MTAARVVKVEDEMGDITGDWDARESKFGGGILAPRRAICGVSFTGYVLCEDPTGRGRQDCVDPLEGSVGGFVVAASLLPGFDDSLIIAINREQCAGGVNGQQNSD